MALSIVCSPSSSVVCFKINQRNGETVNFTTLFKEVVGTDMMRQMMRDVKARMGEGGLSRSSSMTKSNADQAWEQKHVRSYARLCFV